MFESVVGERCAGCGDHLPADDLDGACERLLADLDGVPEWLSDPTDEPMSDSLPAEWAINQSEPGFGTCEPSGWLALDLDYATSDPHLLDDATLVEAMVGFDRLASWAAARQARLLAELAARRPSDRAPHSARWACIGSEYAPDEAGVALHLSRGAACARIGTAVRLLAVLPETHAAWEAGRIDTAKARAVDDATWTLTPELARAVQDRVLPRAPEQTLTQLKGALARAVLAVDEHRAVGRFAGAGQADADVGRLRFTRAVDHASHHREGERFHALVLLLPHRYLIADVLLRPFSQLLERGAGRAAATRAGGDAR